MEEDINKIKFPLIIRFKNEQDEERGFHVLFTSCMPVYSEGNGVWKIFSFGYRKLKEAGIDYDIA